MKHICEEQLALYAWGDSVPQDHHAIAVHLQSCADCRKRLSEFHEARSFTMSALLNPEAGELSKVRTRLAAKLQPQQVRVKPWAWWGAGVAALALLILPRSVQKTEPITAPSVLTESIPPGPTIQIPLTPVAASRSRRLRSQKAGIRAVTLISQADREPVIKMTTADPDVVILWQSSEETEH